MTWFGWFILGVLLGFGLAALLVACVGRESHGRGRTLDFTSRDARGVFKHRTEAVELAPWARIPAGMWAEACHQCKRTPTSLFYACEGCPRLTPEMRREWRELHEFTKRRIG